MTKNLRFLIQTSVTKLSEIWVWDPRSGIRKKFIPDPGVIKAPDPGSRCHKSTGSGSATLLFRDLLVGSQWISETGLVVDYSRRAPVHGNGFSVLRCQAWISVLWIHDILVWIRIRICGSMPLTNGSGSCYFRHWPSRCQQKLVHLHHFSKIKSQKESQNSRNQGFSYYLFMMIEGSGSGSILLTSGSGSGRPKNMRIRIRNTAGSS